MKPVELYFMRHGQTIFNINSKVQGWSDSFLTLDGMAGVEAAGKGLHQSDVQFDHVFSSDSGRTLQTSRIVLEQLKKQQLEVTLEPRLREFNFGLFEGGAEDHLLDAVSKSINVEPEKFHDLDESFRIMTNFVAAENLRQVDAPYLGDIEDCEKYCQRLEAGVESIVEKLQGLGGGKALIISHGMTIATIIQHLSPQSVLPKTWIPNASLTKIIWSDGAYNAEIIGDTTHIELGKSLEV